MELGSQKLAEPLLEVSERSGFSVGASISNTSAQVLALNRATEAAQIASQAALAAAEAARDAAAAVAAATAAMRGGDNSPPDTPDEHDGEALRFAPPDKMVSFSMAPPEIETSRTNFEREGSFAGSECSENAISFFHPGAPRTPNTPRAGTSRPTRVASGDLEAGSISDPPPLAANASKSRRHRLVRRDFPFNQSSGKIFMARSGWGIKALREIATKDWFHVLIEAHLLILCLTTVILYTLIILVFTACYILVDGRGANCGLAPEGEQVSFQTAFAFSIETMTTIGYGIPHDSNAFFANCYELTLTVYAQAMVFILLNAALLGIIFARVGRASTRAAQIIFSDKATIRCVRGRFLFSFQVLCA